MTNQHIETLIAHGARVGSDHRSLTQRFYRRQVQACKEKGYNAITFELYLDGIDIPLMLAIRCSGDVESGDPESVCACLAY